MTCIVPASPDYTRLSFQKLLLLSLCSKLDKLNHRMLSIPNGSPKLFSVTPKSGEGIDDTFVLRDPVCLIDSVFIRLCLFF